MINLLKANKMKKISILLASLIGVLTLMTSCNDEWKDEQYTHYVSFKAQLNDNGVTSVYVPYSRHNDDGSYMYGEEGISSYDLPVIVSGSTVNPSTIKVSIAHDTDTLGILNYARFQSRKDLYYVDMNDYAEYPQNVTIKGGQSVGLFKIKFNFKGIDMVDKWVLPLTIVDDGVSPYPSHPRKNYAKAMLRVYPYNDYSGNYSATTLTLANSEDPSNAIGMETSRAYVVDENTVFFYAGDINEKRTDRVNYKIYAQFIGDSQGSVKLWSDNPAMKFTTDGKASFRIYETMDEVQPYLKHRYVIINNINYSYVDYTSVKGTEMAYTAKGTLTLERKLNTQIPNEDQAIEW